MSNSKKQSKNHNNYGFIRVASAVPKLEVGNVEANADFIIDFIERTAKRGASIVVLPELCITGYTAADLFHQQALQKNAIKALDKIRSATSDYNIISCVGLPLAVRGNLFNVAAVVSRGKILGIIPKTFIPGYKEFYEERWFASARDLTVKETDILGASVPIGTDILFKVFTNPEVILGVEICEDVWAPLPPSTSQVLRGANIVANLSASNDLVGKADYRRELITQQSARNVCGYIYTSCGVHESTTDVVFGGHSIIAENGSILSETKRFRRDGELIISDIDIEHLKLDRERTTSFGESIHDAPLKEFRFVDAQPKIMHREELLRYIDPSPFVPSNVAERDKRVEEIFAIQTAGLAKRLEKTGIKKIVLGLSGGLDSTLALLVAYRTFELLGLPVKNIRAFTMPGFATTKRTKSNAIQLAKALGVSIETIDITKGSTQHLKDIEHDRKTQDVTFQNVQARYRTMILMNKANQIGGLALGTGDLSEIALGWCTFTGDHISHYNVNASIPKTLVKYLVKWVSEQKDFKRARAVLDDILDTPISPELVMISGKPRKIPSGSRGEEISQKTEDLIGPYELHDFFLYHFVRWGSEPLKILFLAQKAFGDKYDANILKKWLCVFIERFFANQWKRSVMPDGPKVGSVSLSPRGDWRMPSDGEVNLWLIELKNSSDSK